MSKDSRFSTVQQIFCYSSPYRALAWARTPGETQVEQIREILKQLEAHVRTARQSRDRQLMRETVIRIRQLRGMLELAA